MFTYQYIKQINSDQLIALIKANGDLELKFSYMDTVGNDVFIYTTEELTESEVVDLDYIVSNYTYAAIIPDVTPRQIRQALILSGITMQQIEDALGSLDEPVKSLARIEWEYSVAFQRNRPLVSQVAAMLGWTETQVDGLWLFAGSL